MRTDYSDIHFKENGKLKFINYRWNPPGDYQAWRGDQQVQKLF